VKQYDIAVIGGGINGSGIARDAAGRGLKTFLCERNDLASATSSASTKLVHGGLRYLEYYKFRLVREALKEREVLWAMAPHIIWPLRFVLPYEKSSRPAWMLRLGLFIYDHLGGRRLLPATRTLSLRRDEAGKVLRTDLDRAFEYSDCWVEDSRLVVLNAADAAARGADIRTRTRCTSAERDKDGWTVTVEDDDGAVENIRARMIVNAAGPWVGEVLTRQLRRNMPVKVRLVQGSHIVVPALYGHDRCYFFQNSDGRIFFAIPYENEFTLIGTTDNDYVGDPADVKASDRDIAYLCDAASHYFRKPVTPSDVVWTYSGVRPLYDDGATEAKAATRDYVLELDEEGGAPLLSVYGGKITTYRKLAEAALAKLDAYLPADAVAKAGWSGRACLPGGDFTVTGFEDLVGSLAADYPFMPRALVRRLARAYGTRTRDLVGQARSMEDLGRDFGGSLTEAEIDYLIRHEWARSAEDVVWRRSKRGLRMSREEITALEEHMRERLAPSRSDAAE
jgi:glycerol-3-phosphate dehydrogenase